jgi:hypothetical protein
MVLKYAYIMFFFPFEYQQIITPSRIINPFLNLLLLLLLSSLKKFSSSSYFIPPISVWIVVS